jgi:hypothetical protein
MNLVKTFQTTTHTVKIYSSNPDLILDDDPSLFEGKDDNQIQDIVFNQLGAEEVLISEGGGENSRSYAIA